MTKLRRQRSLGRDDEVEGIVPASGATRLKRRFRVDEVSGSHPAITQQGSLARLE
jgi:hypothetical protein